MSKRMTPAGTLTESPAPCLSSPRDGGPRVANDARPSPHPHAQPGRATRVRRAVPLRVVDEHRPEGALRMGGELGLVGPPFLRLLDDRIERAIGPGARRLRLPGLLRAVAQQQDDAVALDPQRLDEV